MKDDADDWAKLSAEDQLPLGLALDDSALFENFLLRDDNTLAVNTLKELALGVTRNGKQGGEYCYLWGGGSPGLTHLLQATCHLASARGRAAMYVDLNVKEDLSPALFDGIETLDIICLDGLDAIAGLKDWEANLFTAFNRIKESTASLVVAAKLTPANLPIALPDLKSRLQSGLTLKISPLDDAQKREALILRAEARGMSMSGAVADYIMLRADRGLPALIEVLDKLDESTLQQQRQLTVPLVKLTLGW